MTRVFVVFLFILFSTSCINKIIENNLEIYIDESAKFKLSDQKISNQEIILNQYFQGQYQDKKFYLNTIVQLNDDRIKLIAMNNFGNRLFTINYEGRKIDFDKSSFLQKEIIKPEYIIADLQFIYLPVEDIKNNISADIDVVEVKNNEGIKRLFKKNQRIIIEVIYDKMDRFESDINFKNLSRNYQYNIKNL